MADKRLDALIAHYNEIQIRIDNYETKATNIAIVIITLVCAGLGANVFGTENGFKTLLLCAIPIVTMVGHYQFSMFTRHSAVLQGYSARLEKKINELLQDEDFCWNSEYIDNFLVPKHFLTNRMSSPIFSGFVFLPNVFVFSRLFIECSTVRDNSGILLVGTIALLIIYISISVVLVYDCAINGDVRKRAEQGEVVEKKVKKDKYKKTVERKKRSERTRKNVNGLPVNR